MIKKQKISFLVISIIAFFSILTSVNLYAQIESVVPKDAQALSLLDDHFTFMIANDRGRNDGRRCFNY